VRVRGCSGAPWLSGSLLCQKEARLQQVKRGRVFVLLMKGDGGKPQRVALVRVGDRNPKAGEVVVAYLERESVGSTGKESFSIGKWGADYHSREGFWFLKRRGRPQGRKVMAPCVRRLVFGFFLGKGGRQCVRRFRFFLLSSPTFSPRLHPPQTFSSRQSIFSPFSFYCSMVFIGKVLLGFQTSPSTFPFLFFSSFFFVNFDFSYFFVFLKASNINVNSIRKISDHKIYTLKVERFPNTLKNLNSFEMTLRMLKTMQIYQKCIFWGFHFFLLFLVFLKKIYQNIGQKLGSNTTYNLI